MFRTRDFAIDPLVRRDARETFCTRSFAIDQLVGKEISDWLKYIAVGAKAMTHRRFGVMESVVACR